MNIPQPSAPAAAAPVAAPAPVAPSLEDRIAGVNDMLDGASSESAGEQGASAPAPAKTPASPAPSGDAAAQQRAIDRRERLASLTLQTREQVDRKAQQAAAEKMARDFEAVQRRADDAEKLAAGRMDVSNLDEAGLFALAERRNVSPQRLGEWIRNAMTNPEKLAEAAALQATRTTYDPKLSALEARIADQDRRIAAYEQAQQAQQAGAEEHRQTQAFLGMVSQSHDRAPLAAKLLATDPDEFMEMASLAAPRVPGMGPEALLDAVEELLDGEGRKVAQKYAALYGITSQPAAPHVTPTRGAAKPTTVSNSLAQERASLVDEDDFASLPIEERAARLIRSM